MARELKNGRTLASGNKQIRIMVRGVSHTATFGPLNREAAIKAWKDGLRTKPAARATKGSFEADVVEDYLPTVTAKPTYNQIEAHLQIWLDALGRERATDKIEPREINKIMNDWLITPSVFGPGQKGRPTRGRGLDPQTIRKRRSNLQTFFVSKNGPTGYNPVRGTWCPKAPKAEVRGTDYATIARIIAAMPTYRDTKKGTAKKLNLGKLRVDVMAHTGIPPGMLGTINRRDLHLSTTRPTVRVMERLKGGGVEARTLELTPGGVAAFQRFAAADAFGPFAEGALNRSFQKAAARIGVFGLTVYDLRHSFGALVYAVTRDLATVARFLGHAEGSKMTLRYAAAAFQQVDQAAAASVGNYLATLPPVEAAPVAAPARALRMVAK